MSTIGKEAGKLSKAQDETLADIERFGERGTHYADHYPPIKKLVALGFIEPKQLRFSSGYRITKAGTEYRAALSRAKGEA